MSISEPKYSQSNAEQLARRVFFGWVFGLLVFDLLTLRWFPVPWYDEVLFADPAVSFLLKGHWASTIWFGRGDFTYWGGNVPAYSALLIPWLWVWGVSEQAVRSLNCTLFAITLICTWFSLKRLNLIPVLKIRLATLCALSLCYPVAYCVRCGRPDVLAMLIFSLTAFFWASPQRFTACLGLFICTIFIPFVGLHYAFYMPVLLGALLWVGGKPALGRLGAIVGGGIAGTLLLLAYYQFFAGWDGLLASMSNVHDRLPPGLWNRVHALVKDQILFYYFGRPHFVLLIAMVIVLGFAWKSLSRISQRTLLLAAIMLLVPGVVLGLFSHFMAPYHWLAVVPATILLASAVSQSWETISLKSKVACAILMLGLAGSGRLMFVLMGWGVDDANYTAQLEKAAIAQVRPGENVFIEPQVYYALKPRAGRMYVKEIVPQLTGQEKEAVSVAFLLQGEGLAGNPEWFTNRFSGHWIHMVDLPVPCARAKESPLLSKLLGWFHAGAYIGEPLCVYRREPVTRETPSP